MPFFPFFGAELGVNFVFCGWLMEAKRLINSQRVETPLSSNIKLWGPVCSNQNVQKISRLKVIAENELCSQNRNMINHFYCYTQENIYLKQPRKTRLKNTPEKQEKIYIYRYKEEVFLCRKFRIPGYGIVVYTSETMRKLYFWSWSRLDFKNFQRMAKTTQYYSNIKA